MKKSVLLSALALAVSMGAQAKTADELRVYINPGHGSWTANDRPAGIVGHGEYSRTNTDTTSFFESNTNLRKGFGVLETLREAGLKFDPTLNQTGERWQIGAARDMSNNIVMSHVKCGPYHSDNGTASQLGDATPADIEYYNRNLTEIGAEAMANHIDMFISIHSNAASEGSTSNFPLFLYNGYDTPANGTGYVEKEKSETSSEMANAAWKYAIENTHGQWTAYTTSKNIRGDVNFYGSGSAGYLGVLKHNVPGYLVEGYFHTYQPARHRAMNWDVCYLEGNAYARGIIDYYNLTQSKNGMIYGVVRDKNEKFKDKYYTPNPSTDDAYLPLNGVTVTLKNGEEVVDTYVTDDQYNGAFVFKGVAPGTYTIEFEHPDYNDVKTPVEVTVKAAQNVYPTAFLVNKSWEPPKIVYENYPDVTVPGFILPDEYEFKQEYADTKVTKLSDAFQIKRILPVGEDLIILANKNDSVLTPKVFIYNTLTNDEKNISVSGAKGSITAISDIQMTADGYLIAMNGSINHFDANKVEEGETRGTTRIYRWAKDEETGLPTGKPKSWFTSQLSGNWNRAQVSGNMAYTGTIEEGTLLVQAANLGKSDMVVRFNRFTVVDSVKASQDYIKEEPTDRLAASKLGNYLMTTSPLDKNELIVTSENYTPSQYFFNEGNLNNHVYMPKGFADNIVATSFFRFQNHAYMVVADNADGKNIGLRLLDITDGIKNPTHIATINTTLEANEGTSNIAVAGNVIPTYDAEDNVTDAYINLYIVRNSLISKFTTKGVVPEAHANPLVYDLKVEETPDGRSLNFKSTQDVDNAYIVLTGTSDADDTITYPTSVTKGQNAFTVNLTDIGEGKSYTWAVELHAKTNTVPGLISSIPSKLSVRGSAISMNDPEYPEAFGRIVIGHGKGEGYDVYEADGTQIASRLFYHHANIATGHTNQSNSFRGDAYKNYAILPCWGDAAYGVLTLDVANLDEPPHSLFPGTKDGTGCHTYNGVKLGGGSAGACILGDGDNMRMYSYAEDVEGKNGGGATENSLWMHKINPETMKIESISQLPENGYKTLLANGQADLQACGNGFFACQSRGSGNNVKGCPVFAYIDGDTHKVTFQSNVIEDLLSGNSFAISKDGKKAVAGSSYDNLYHVYNVTWDGNEPTFEHVTNFKGASSPQQYTHMRFDYAGNLHVYQPSGNYEMYALPSVKPVITVPAKSSYLVTGTSAVNNISVDSEDAPVMYYNLQGVRVNGESLLPGVYVKVQGKTATKVVIK